MSRTRIPGTDDGLTDEQRKAAIGELLALGAINAVRGPGHAEDRGDSGHGSDETTAPKKSRGP